MRYYRAVSLLVTPQLFRLGQAANVIISTFNTAPTFKYQIPLKATSIHRELIISLHYRFVGNVWSTLAISSTYIYII